MWYIRLSLGMAYLTIAHALLLKHYFKAIAQVVLCSILYVLVHMAHFAFTHVHLLSKQESTSCGRAKIMIIPLKVKKSPLASQTHIYISRNNATCKQFRLLEKALCTKRNERSPAKIKKIKHSTFLPQGKADRWQTILPRFSPAL